MNLKYARIILVLAAILIAVERTHAYQHGGFCLRKVTSHLSEDQTKPYESAPNNVSPQIPNLLKQNFHFLGSGGTCFAFLGEDKKTVLKLFKHQHLESKSFFSNFPVPPLLKPLKEKYWRFQSQKHPHKRLPFLFNSCKIAYESLRQGTGLIYLTLKKNPRYAFKVKLFDKWGIPHTYDLSQTEFALQKYAIPLFTFLEDQLKHQNIEACKHTIDSLLFQIYSRAQKQIGDRDPNLLINYGVIGTQVIELDIGSFFKYPGNSSRFTIMQELFFSTFALQRWLEEKNPELLKYTQEQIIHAVDTYTYQTSD